MNRLLSVVLLAALLAGLAGAPASRADDRTVVSSQAGGASGEPMTAMDCSACAGMGACSASGPAPSADLGASRVPLVQPSSRAFGQVPAPETAPPKPFSI